MGERAMSFDQGCNNALLFCFFHMMHSKNPAFRGGLFLCMMMLVYTKKFLLPRMPAR